MQRLFLLGLNHTTAPLEVRERLAFSPAQQRQAIERFRETFPECELVLISTCNRVEMYIARAPHGHPRVEELVEFIADFHGVSASAVAPHVYEKRDREVVEHLFTVASSLDSMVIGETQILGQVREAYSLAAEVDSVDAALNPLFQKALAAGKEVMTQTGLAEGRRSVASVAVDYAHGVFERFDDKTVLSIGAGKMANLVLRGFANLQPGKLIVTNRDPAKATELANTFNGLAEPFENLTSLLAAADVVLTGTGSLQPIITSAMFDRVMKLRKYKPIFLIDLAVPRDVEPAIGQLDNVYLYNVDHLQEVVGQTQQIKAGTLDAARAIVKKHVDGFASWHRARELGPAIDKLYQHYHSIAREELDRTLGKFPDMSAQEREHLEDLTRRIVNKLLHIPVQTLRNSDAMHAPTTQYLHALEKLFHLDPNDKKDSPHDA